MYHATHSANNNMFTMIPKMRYYGTILFNSITIKLVKVNLKLLNVLNNDFSIEKSKIQKKTE